jgi:hypothetical protein
MIHFQPLIAKVDKYLSGWCSLLLSAGGQIVLLNAVLDALPAYAMGTLELPPALLRAIDALRRAFLWNFDEKASGANCLVAWDKVCRPKCDGGLGLRCLATQNKCMQVKLLHKLHTVPDSSWASWAWDAVRGPIAAGNIMRSGPHWASLVKLVPLYRSISCMSIGNGARTCFWSENWLGEGDLRSRFPALFSHAVKPDASVAAVLRSGLRACLVPRLTAAGECELTAVEARLVSVCLNDAHDLRFLVCCTKRTGDLSVAKLYAMCMSGAVPAPFAGFVWQSFSPSRVKFFMWLLVQSRIQSRASLLAKHIIRTDEASCPICSAPSEDASHIVLGCPFVQRFWRSFGARIAEDADVRQLHALPGAIAGATASNFTALCCWNMWKHRNGVVSNGDRPCLRRLAAACVSDAVLWKERVPNGLCADGTIWESRLRLALTL